MNEKPANAIDDILGLIIRLAVLAVIAAVAGLIVVNSESLTESSIKRWWNNNYSAEDALGVTMTSVEVGQQKFVWPQWFEMTDVSARFDGPDGEITLSCDGLSTDDLRTVFRAPPAFSGEITDLSLIADPTRLEGVGAKFDLAVTGAGVPELKANVNGASLRLHPYEITGIKANVLADPEKVAVNNFSGDWAGGRITGGVLVSFDPYVNFLSELQLEGIDVSELQEVQPEVFSRIRGRFDGDLRLSGRLDRIDGFVGTVKTEEARLEPGLVLRMFEIVGVAGVPLIDSLGAERVDRIRNSREFIPFQQVRMSITNFNYNTMTTIIRMNSRELNMNLELTLDIRVQGGLSGLLRVIKALPRVSGRRS